MPPVRWKPLAAAAALTWLAQVVICANAQLMQEAISMTADGWRPIVGTHKEPSYSDQILHYRNQNGESIRAETPSTQAPASTSHTTPPKHPRPPTKPGKVPPHTKHPQVSWGVAAHGAHAPHIPIGHARPAQIKKYPTNKPFLQVPLTGKRHYAKPVRAQNHNRDEIFVGAPSQGAYTFYKPSQNNIKTRETLGLGLPGGNHFSLNQPNLDFTTRFALPPTGESVFQHYNTPLQGFIFPKHPQNNEIKYQFQNQNDEYTRNLVPPPLLYQDKQANQAKEPQNEIADNSQLLPARPRVPENVAVQLPVPPSFDFPHHRQKVNEPVQVQVTKEKLNTFHNNIPPNYNGQYVDYEFHGLRNPITELRNPITELRNPITELRNPITELRNPITELRNPLTELPKPPTYEVTEVAKPWQEASQFVPRPRKPSASPVKKRPLVELNYPPFLPTPYLPEGQAIVPTSPTQNEVSTIFTKLSKMQKDKFTTNAPSNDPSLFDVKEVSTHFPILGKPSFEFEAQTQFALPVQEVSNDITTTKPVIEEVVTTQEPQRSRPHRRRRPIRYRTTTTTTTQEPMVVESYESQKTQEDETSLETERPYIRQRGPTRYRTTTMPSSTESGEVFMKSTRGRTRYRIRPTGSDNDLEQPIRKRVRPIKLEIATEPPQNHKMVESEEETTESMSQETEEATEEVKASSFDPELPGRHYVAEEESKTRFETVQPLDEEVEAAISTTEAPPATNLHLPENEVDPASHSTEEVEETEEEVTTVTEATTTTQKPNRLRGRPIKFDNSNRPRFSVKDYRQKLNQYSSTSTTTTTESYRTSSDSLRLRFSNRLRRPTTTTTTTAVADVVEEETTEPIRAKFVPKEPRHGATTEVLITDKNVKAVNTRLRPFGRYRSTTAPTTTTPKVSIKPNLFARRRPTPISLRTKIYNKHHKNATEEKATTEESSTEETTPNEEETTTEDGTTKSKSTVGDFETATTEASKIDQVDYSQRVSDLTSSSKNDYNTPGLFKSVSPTSRRIPSYFTIATDDPILPIEAFFPNIKDKNKDNDN